MALQNGIKVATLTLQWEERTLPSTRAMILVSQGAYSPGPDITGGAR